MANRAREVKDGKQRCSKCREWKDEADFGKNKRYKNGREPVCRSCIHDARHIYYSTKEYRKSHALWMQSYRKTDRGFAVLKRHEFNKNLKTRYGITAGDYERMHKEQDGKCAVCGKAPGEYMLKSNGRTHTVNNFSIDHDHVSGKVRGLLCRKCNLGIGYLNTVGVLDSAIKYLRKGEKQCT